MNQRGMRLTLWLDVERQLDAFVSTQHHVGHIFTGCKTDKFGRTVLHAAGEDDHSAGRIGLDGGATLCTASPLPMQNKGGCRCEYEHRNRQQPAAALSAHDLPAVTQTREIVVHFLSGRVALSN